MIWYVVVCHSDQAYYVIRSALNGMVLDIEDADRDSGADVVMWEFTGADNQLWYTNHHGVVASKLNDFVLDASCKFAHLSLPIYLHVFHWSSHASPYVLA